MNEACHNDTLQQVAALVASTSVAPHDPPHHPRGGWAVKCHKLARLVVAVVRGTAATVVALPVAAILSWFAKQ